MTYLGKKAYRGVLVCHKCDGHERSDTRQMHPHLEGHRVAQRPERPQSAGRFLDGEVIQASLNDAELFVGARGSRE